VVERKGMQFVVQAGIHIDVDILGIIYLA